MSHHSTHHIIVLAAGAGMRARQEQPKQFARICGIPLLMHTLQSLAKAPLPHVFTLVLPLDYVAYWKELCKECDFSLPHRVVVGGETRYQSAQRALNSLATSVGSASHLVALHDGSRPFVRPALVRRCFEEAGKNGSAVPVVPLQDSIRKKDSMGQTVPKDRTKYLAVQTPQVFSYAALKKAYEQCPHGNFTDDAQVVEHAGYPIHCIAGDTENKKITCPEDLLWASFWLAGGKRREGLNTHPR